MKRTKAARCKVGASCGLSCISKKLICRKTLPDQVQGRLDAKAGRTPYFKSEEDFTEGELEALRNPKLSVTEMYDLTLSEEGQTLVREYKDKEEALKKKEKEILTETEKLSDRFYEEEDLTVAPIVKVIEEGYYKDLKDYEKNRIAPIRKEMMSFYERFNDESLLPQPEDDYIVLSGKEKERRKITEEADLWKLKEGKKFSYEEWNVINELLDIQIPGLEWGDKPGDIKNYKPEFTRDIDRLSSKIEKGYRAKMADFYSVEGEIKNLNAELTNKLDGDIRVSGTKRRDIDPILDKRKRPRGDGGVLQGILDKQTPMMMIGKEGLLMMAEPGFEFKNVYELEERAGIGGGLDPAQYKKYLSLRRREENKKFGLNNRTPADMRPVYGFMAGGDDIGHPFPNNGRNLGDYGKFMVEFAPELKDSVTVTFDDSLGGKSYNVGSPANAVSKESIPEHRDSRVNENATSYRDLYAGAKRPPRYIEWQSSNKPTTSQINRIHIPLNEWVLLPLSEKQALRSLGVDLNIISPRK